MTLAPWLGKIERLGVTVTTDHRVEDVEAEMKDGRFDACFVAVGAHLSKRTDVPARDRTDGQDGGFPCANGCY